MAHQISSQRHSHDVKPLMDVTVTRYKDADLAIFKEVILKKIAKAKEEIDFYTDQIKILLNRKLNLPALTMAL